MLKRSATILTICSLAACGGSNGSTGSENGVPVSVGFSDAPVENVTAAVITVEAIVITAGSGEVIRIDEFYNEDNPDVPLEQFQINLLEYQGADYKLVSQNILLESGNYQQLNLEIVDDDIAEAYVQEQDGAMKPIKVPSDTLRLGGFTVESSGAQTFIVEFDLRQAMTYNPGPDRYILKPRGVRIIESSASASVSGTVDLAYINSLEPCASKSDKSVGNVMYLYPGHELGGVMLLDQLEPDLIPLTVGGSLAPYTSVGLDELGQYEMAFLPPGEYSLAFSCVAYDDHPETRENLEIPSPDNGPIEITLSAGESVLINFPSL